MPNIFQKVLSYFQRKSFLTTGQHLSLGEAINKPNNKDYLDAYECSFLVNACVSKIAKKVATTEFKLYKVGGRAGKEKITEEKSHEALDLLAQVNPFMTKFAMLDLIQTYLELLGNAYLYKVRAERGKKILELWPLRPDWVTIIQDETEFIKHYEYRLPSGQVQQFATEDIIHFKQTNPKSSLYGLPTIKAAMDVVRTLIYATRWNMNFFNNSAMPDTLLITKTAMTSEQKKEFRERWESKYQGYQNAHKLGILEGEVELKQLMMSMRDMEFDKLTNSTTQQILTAFGVPKSILGIQGMNRAEAEAQIYAFLSETIEPKIRAIIEVLNEFLIPEFGDNLFLDFEDPTPANREAKVKEYESGIKNNWLLINEVRDHEGLPPVKGGWDFYLPMSMIPVGGSEEETKHIKIKGITEKEYKNHKEEKEQEKLRKKILTGKRGLKLKMKLKSELIKYFLANNKKILKSFTDEQKKSWWEEHSALTTSDERLFVVFARKLFKNQESRIKEALESELLGKNIKNFKKKVLGNFNWDMENHIFFELAFPVFTDITKRRGKRASGLIGTEFNLTEDVIEKINKKTILFAKRVNETTREKLKQELGKGVAAGEGVPKLTDRVSEVFKERRRYESERIARTEVISAANSAELEAYKQSGIIEKKEWLIEPDACDICVPMSGEVVKLRERFSGGFEYPPQHPNCLIDGQVPVYTSKGFTPISKIKAGDLVLTHKARFRKVKQLIRTPKQEANIVKISVGNKFLQRDTLALTEDHPVLISGEWKPAKELQKGDKIKLLANECKRCKKTIPYYNQYCSLSCNSKDITKKQHTNREYNFVEMEIKNIQNFSLKKPRTLWNLEVEEDESYLAKGFVVHNCRCTILPVIE